MIRINLLPFRAARTKENVRRQVTIFSLLLIFLVIALFGISLYFKGQIDSIRKQVSAVETELEGFTLKAKEVDQINRKKLLLQKKIDIINDLELVRKEPITILEAMTDLVIAERMWFTEMSIKGTSILIKGIALDEITIADFTSRLQTSPLILSANLKFLKQSASMGINMKSFEISCTKARQGKSKKRVTSKAVK